MKKINTIIFAAILGLALISGQAPVVASQSTGDASSQGRLVSHTYDGSTDEFSVEIVSVGPDLLTELEVQDDGTYHLVSDNANPTARIVIEFSGYTYMEKTTSYLAGNQTKEDDPETFIEVNDTYTYSADMAYGGQLFQIVNGESSILGSGPAGSLGATALLSSDVNVITFLYIGKGDGGTQWASTTIVIRVAADENGFPDFREREMEFDNEITDAAVEAVENGEKFNTSGVIVDNDPYYGGYYYDRNQISRPTIDVEYDGARNRFKLDGVVNTSGFDGQQMDSYFDLSTGEFIDGTNDLVMQNRTIGQNFIIDASGVTPLEDVENVVLYESNVSSTISHVSLFSVMEYGYWDFNQDISELNADWDSLFSYSTLRADGVNMPDTNPDNVVNGTIISGYEGGMFGTFDYIGNIFDVVVKADSTDYDSPGFGVVITLFTAGAIAYIAPRMRKD